MFILIILKFNQNFLHKYLSLILHSNRKICYIIKLPISSSQLIFKSEGHPQTCIAFVIFSFKNFIKQNRKINKFNYY